MAPNLSIAICDDDTTVIKQIKTIIHAYAQASHEPMDIFTYRSGEAFVQALENGDYYDLAFVDIRLGGITGLQLGEVIRNKLEHNLMHIYYMSGYLQDTRAILKAQPLDLIPKPLKKEDIYNALNKSKELLQHYREKIFTFQTRGGRHKIPVKYIYYFYSSYGRIMIASKSGTYECCSITMKKIYAELKPYRFFYCDRSYLVNFAYVISLTSETLTLSETEETLPVARSRYVALILINEIQDILKHSRGDLHCHFDHQKKHVVWIINMYAGRL